MITPSLQRVSTRDFIPLTPGYIEIGTPQPGQKEGRTFRAIGVSNVFEGAMRYALRDSEGAVVDRGSIQATSGSGTPGRWEDNIRVPRDAQAGTYTLRVFARSAEDGSIAESDSVSFHVPARGGDGAGYDPAFIDIAPPTMLNTHGTAWRLEGTSNTFEGTAVWVARNADGKRVAHGTVQATSGSGHAGFFTERVRLGDVASGRYEITLKDLGGEGLEPRAAIRDSVTVRVR